MRSLILKGEKGLRPKGRQEGAFFNWTSAKARMHGTHVLVAHAAVAVCRVGRSGSSWVQALLCFC